MNVFLKAVNKEINLIHTSSEHCHDQIVESMVAIKELL